MPLRKPDAVYVPVDVGGDHDILVQLSGAGSITKASWRFAPMADQLCQSMPNGWTELELPRFEHEPLKIALPEATAPEICLEVSALPTEGNSWITKRWKIRSGP